MYCKYLYFVYYILYIIVYYYLKYKLKIYVIKNWILKGGIDIIKIFKCN